MSFPSRRLPVSWGCVCIALFGAAYCGILASPAQSVIPCPGTGCRLFREFTIHGISLWWAGTAYFGVMALLCLRRAADYALALAGLALALDAVLLVIMLATVPCVSCLGAAALIGLLFLLIRDHVHSGNMLRPRASALFLLWGGLFVAVGATAVLEQAGTWVLHGEEHAERRVYFSPSCPACRDAVAVFADNAAFVPVAERESDYAAIYRMRTAIARGESLAKALESADADAGPVPQMYTPGMVLLRLRIMRNKAEVLRLGFDSLPLIMINGMPRSLRPQTGDTGGADRKRRVSPSDLPPELLDKADSCGENSPEPCPPSP